MEKIDTLNQRLEDFYGCDSDTGKPIFRIVWANSETEKRMMDTTDTGVQLLYPAVREVKKYPYLKDLYVLERLVVVPEMNLPELPATKLSYEPLWAFRDPDERFIYPSWDAAKFIVDTLYAALGKSSMAKYVDDEKNTTKEGRDQRIQELQGELFGNETETSDALKYKQGIVVPNSYDKGE
jgi:hypothetical protein